MAKELSLLGNCPVCKMPMAMEMIPFGFEHADKKGKQKKKILLGNLLPQIIRYSGESAIRAMIGSGRSLYYYCGNEDCPAHYTPANQNYFKKTPVGTFELVGDLAGLRLSALQGQYKKKKYRRMLE